MTATTRIRRIAAGAAIASLVIGGSLVFEQSAGATAGGNQNQTQNHGNGVSNGHPDENGIPRHCTDGHGHDGDHNPHCRPSS